MQAKKKRLKDSTGTYIAPITHPDAVIDGEGKTLTQKLNELPTGGSTYTLPIATSTVLGGIKVGSGLTITNGVLSANSSGSSTGGLTFKGLLSDFVSITDNYAGYFNVNLTDGIYLVLDSNKPSQSNPPFAKEDFYLIHQNRPKDGSNWAYQEAFAVSRPQIKWTRRCLMGSLWNDGRQQKWEYVGANDQLTRYSRLKMLTLGDSISAKWAGDPVDAVSYPQSMTPYRPSTANAMYDTGYQAEIFKRMRIDIWTLARGGSKMTRTPAFTNYDPYSLPMITRPVGATQKADTGGIDLTPYDVLTIKYGTNDVGWGLPIGTIDSVNTEEFYGAMNVGIEQIYAQNPDIQIFFITPPPRMDIYKSTNPDNLTLKQQWEACRNATKPYEEAIEAIGLKYGIPVFNSYTKSGVNFYNYSKYMNVDLIHYDDYSLWGGRITEWLKQHI